MLRSTLLLLFGFVSAVTVSAQGQTGVIKTNVLGYFAGQYQIAYEHVVTPSSTFQLSLGYLGGGGSGSSTINGVQNDYEVKRSGFIAIPEYRMYFGGDTPEGVFVSAFGRYRSASNDLTDSGEGITGTSQDLSRVRKTTTFGGGLTVGYQFVGDNGVTLDIFAGPQYKARSLETTYDNADLNALSTSDDHELVGDELFNQKYLDFKLAESEGIGVRFGFHLGYAF